MSLVHHVEGRTDVGREREHNEDAFDHVALDPVSLEGAGGKLLVVCDGMGGHEAGEVASAVATRHLIEALQKAAAAAPGDGSAEDPGKALEAALRGANEAVMLEADRTGRPTMGTTAVAAWVVGDQLWYGWVGDSRLYVFRKGELLQRSKDHTHVQRLVDLGVITLGEARHHPDSNVLIQALGGGRGAQAEFSPSRVAEPFTLQQGDVVLLCSDGLYDRIDDDEIYPLIAEQVLGDALQSLVDEANRRGGYDNITVLMLIAGQDRVEPMQEGLRAADPVVAVDESSDQVWQGRVARFAFPLLSGLGAGMALSYWLRHRG